MTQLTLRPPGASLRSVHPEDSTEHGQEQGHLQEEQQQEVDAAEQGPALGVVAGHSWGDSGLFWGDWCWVNGHFNLESRVSSSSLNPTPVSVFIVSPELLHGHGEREVSLIVPDGHTVPLHLLL